MKRTTLILASECLAKLKILAAKEKRTLSSLVDEFLREGLRKRTERKPVLKSFILPSFSLGKPRVNLSDRDQLEEVMTVS